MNDDKELLDQVAAEFMKAIETKDKAMMVDALTALVLNIQDQDKEQDEQEMT